MLSGLSFQEILSSFLVLFAVIDITGAIPIIMGINSGGQKVKAGKAAVISLIIYVAFLFAGDWLLKLFNTADTVRTRGGDDFQHRDFPQ